MVVEVTGVLADRLPELARRKVRCSYNTHMYKYFCIIQVQTGLLLLKADALPTLQYEFYCFGDVG
jgi:hypothetical protein